ncbi:MAG: hypothetical protein AAF228_07665 [Pseudomonadota bacterium]
MMNTLKPLHRHSSESWNLSDYQYVARSRDPGSRALYALGRDDDVVCFLHIFS